MNSRDTKANRRKRLPGRVYTLLVTSLATVLVVLPLMRPSTESWNLGAVISHPEVPEPETAEQLVRDHLQSAAESAGILANANEANLAVLQSKLVTTTKPSSDGSSYTTTIQFQYANQRQARDVVGKLADALAEAAAEGSDQAQVVSIEAHPIGGIPPGKLFGLLICSLTVGLTTIFFPRRRSRPTESNADKLQLVTDATGLPIIGSVLATQSEQSKKKSSCFPLRLTAFAAELVVAGAFLLVLVTAATDGDFLTQMIQSPLDAYAQCIRTAGTQFQSVLQR